MLSAPVRAVTTTSDTEDMIRRQLATLLRVGLLTYITRDAVPQRLEDLRRRRGDDVGRARRPVEEHRQAVERDGGDAVLGIGGVARSGHGRGPRQRGICSEA